MIRPLSSMSRMALLAFILTVPGLPAPADEPTESATAPRSQYLSETPHLSVIGRAPNFTLYDTNGEKVRLSDYKGRVVLLAFVFTSCPGVCPLISTQMSLLQGQLKKQDLFADKACLLSVTVDPETDTAPVLAAYANTYGADPAGWRFLRDEPPRLRKVMAAYNEWTKKLSKGDLDHPARVYLLDPEQRIREIYSLSFFDERQTYLDIQALLAERR